MVDADLRDAPLTLAAGDLLLDRYRVVSAIGEGGYSRVYHGHDERLDRPVCVKLFHRLPKRTKSYAASYDQFVQEAFALSKLAHPSTLRIFDFGHVGDSGPPFQITELATGGTLAARVRERGPISRAETVSLVTGLCGALAEAHGVGIVHRDIKPSNILVSAAGSTEVMKLGDFGVAKALAADPASGRDGGGPRMYSRRWAAPEQMTDYPVTSASDLYSLALVIVFAVTGRVVFARSEPGPAYAERTAGGERVGELLREAEIPDDCRDALQRAASFDPRRRPSSADELCRELVAALRADAPAGAPTAPARDSGSESAAAPAETRRPLRAPVPLTGASAVVGDREIRVLQARGGEVEIEAGGARLQVGLVPTGGDAACVHLKAVGGFVQRRGGRPTRAVQLVEPGEIADVEILAASGATLAGVRVALSFRDRGEVALAAGELEIAPSPGTACRHAVLVEPRAAAAALIYLPTGPGPEASSP